MSRLAYTLCALLAVAVAAGVLVVYGVSGWTLAVAVVLLLCPVGVAWVSWRLARQSEQDVAGAVRDELARRRQP